MRTELYDYRLPPDLIAQYPTRVRRNCRMLVLDRRDGALHHARFTDLPEFLNRGDRLVFNNTRVIPARLFGVKIPTGGKVEIFLLRKQSDRTWSAMVRPNYRCRPGTQVELDRQSGFKAVIGDHHPPDKRFVRLICRGSPTKALEKYGHTPLPPYIRRPDTRPDQRDYQTVFARKPGAVAAPTAGLHFDPVILKQLAAAGIKNTEVTLHVGEGSFRPIRSETVEGHRLGSEYLRVTRCAITRLAGTRRRGKRIVAVGTTVVRTLETIAHWHRAPVEHWDQPAERPVRTSGESELFIKPPFTFRVVDSLLTNFHLPRSSLLVLVGAFASREMVRAAYAAAVEKKYRFYSYGDCMLIR